MWAVNWTTSAWILAYVVLLSLIGLLMNAVVIVRMRRLQRRSPEQHRNGVGLCLHILAIMDVVSLVVFVIQLFALEYVFKLFNEQISTLSCKTLAFIAHLVYSESMWSYGIMSILRFLATKRPLQYTTLWRIPIYCMSSIFIIATLLNSWLLISVSYDTQTQTCVQEYSTTTQIHRIVDVVLSFFLPTLLVVYMDFSVLCCRIQSPLRDDPMLQIVINRPTSEKRKSINRFLIITVSCISLNLPEMLFRLISALNESLIQESVSVELIVLSKAMFYSQFVFKSFYLTTFVYHRSVLSKTNSSRQLSLSFRQRLEENSHMIRERANTYSYYRTSSPIPQQILARNASCAALDQLVPGKYSF
ncbi:hypothetical protein M3Y98_00241800 [Aphelenchoides besseyi]|nr:hypothetical protein M3Y98_00241800 [Aphelenchoides besseyi]KAI6200679.1 hypothetical protein M3Y96_00759800 [Aphelenchoides besseyi]